MRESVAKRRRQLPPPGPAPINMLRRPGSAFLIQYVAAKTRVPVKVILGREQNARVVAARHDAMRTVFAHTELTSSQIGRAFNRHHATVLYAVGHVTRGSKSRVDREADRIRAQERVSSLNRRLQWKPPLIPAIPVIPAIFAESGLLLVSAAENGHM
jgi:hypothetical protein